MPVSRPSFYTASVDALAPRQCFSTRRAGATGIINFAEDDVYERIKEINKGEDNGTETTPQGRTAPMACSKR